MSKTQNIEEIIVCATGLFARQGYDGTSLRQIAHDAGVGLGTINFCFQTKENLFQAVIRQVIDEINTERRLMLRAARAEGLSIERVLESSIWPVVSRATSTDLTERGKPYLVRWATHGPRAVETYARKLNDMISREFIDAILEATPGLERHDAVWGYSVVISASYSRHVLDQRYEHLIGPRPAGPAPDRAVEATQRLVGFVAGGLRALADGRLPILAEHPQSAQWRGPKTLSRH